MNELLGSKNLDLFFFSLLSSSNIDVVDLKRSKVQIIVFTKRNMSSILFVKKRIFLERLTTINQHSNRFTDKTLLVGNFTVDLILWSNSDTKGSDLSLSLTDKGHNFKQWTRVQNKRP